MRGRRKAFLGGLESSARGWHSRGKDRQKTGEHLTLAVQHPRSTLPRPGPGIPLSGTLEKNGWMTEQIKNVVPLDSDWGSLPLHNCKTFMSHVLSYKFN